MFRLVFALLHTIKWNYRLICNSKYRIEKINLNKLAKEIASKAEANGGNSSDEDDSKYDTEKIDIFGYTDEDARSDYSDHEAEMFES